MLDELNIDNLTQMPYYFPQDPPYFLMVASLVASILSGLAFEAVLKQSVQDWANNRSTRSLATLRGTSLLLPFLGMCGGVCFFLAAGMQIFGLPGNLAYGASLVLTVVIGRLVWVQLGSILKQLEAGGSKALDLDSFI